MLKKQFLLAVTIVGLGIGIFVVLKQLNWDNPQTNISNTITPNDLLIKSLSSEKYINADDLATRIINEDPSYVLIDIRDKVQFEAFTLPNAINIFPENILSDKSKQLFSKEAKFVLFSKKTLEANQVWMLLRREGFRNIIVLEGGLDKFFSTIMNPQKPTEVESEDAFDLYRFRKAAGVYFGLPNPDEFIPEQKFNFPTKTLARRNKKMYKTVPKKTVRVKKKTVTKTAIEQDDDEGC